MAKKKIDILDFLPEEGMEKLDEVGYSFLQERGYDTTGALESEEKRAEIKRAMKKKGEELQYCGAVDKDSGSILVWFEILQGGKAIARSQGIKFIPIKKDPVEGGGEDE